MLLYYHLLVISMIRIGERQKKVDFYLKKKKKNLSVLTGLTIVPVMKENRHKLLTFQKRSFMNAKDSSTTDVFLHYSK